MKNKQIIDKLNHLLTRNYDAEYGYKEAAREVKDPDLQKLFKTYVEQRYKFGHELKADILNLGGNVKEKGTSVAGDIHRKWMDFKTAISSNNEITLLEECRRGEMITWEDYNEALSVENLPELTFRMLKEHKVKIDEALYQLMELKDNYSLSK